VPSQQRNVGLFNAWFFRIGLLAVSLCAFVIFFAHAADRLRFSLHGVRATITRASSTQDVPIDAQWVGDRHDFYVKATARDGKESFVTLLLSRRIIEQLVDGGRAEVVYVRDNPRKLLMKGDALPSPGIGWLIFGLAVFPVFLRSLRLN
jgi:hypothetical protein